MFETLNKYSKYLYLVSLVPYGLFGLFPFHSYKQVVLVSYFLIVVFFSNAIRKVLKNPDFLNKSRAMVHTCTKKVVSKFAYSKNTSYSCVKIGNQLFVLGLIFMLSLLFNNSMLAQISVFTTDANGTLYSLDLINCTSRLIGSTGHQFGDIAVTPNGKLWGVENCVLYQINTLTASCTLIGNTGICPISLVDFNDTTLIGDGDSYTLYSINTNNASTHLIDTIWCAPAGDLTWYDNDLYMVTGVDTIGNNGVFKITFNSSYSAITGVAYVGGSDSIITLGSITVPLTCNYNAIIGFGNNQAIKFCQINGSSSVLCPNLYIGGVASGAATLRLPIQIPPSNSCEEPENSSCNFIMPSAFSPNGDDANDVYFPVPASTQVKVFRVYNRWGEKIYETSGINVGWDGKYKGEPQPVDVYAYYIEVKNINGQMENRIGSFTLLR